MIGIRNLSEQERGLHMFSVREFQEGSVFRLKYKFWVKSKYTIVFYAKIGVCGYRVMSRSKHLVELQQVLHLLSKEEFQKGYIFRVKYRHMINSEFAIVFSMKNRVCA